MICILIYTHVCASELFDESRVLCPRNVYARTHTHTKAQTHTHRVHPTQSFPHTCVRVVDDALLVIRNFELLKLHFAECQSSARVVNKRRLVRVCARCARSHPRPRAHNMHHITRGRAHVHAPGAHTQTPCAHAPAQVIKLNEYVLSTIESQECAIARLHTNLSGVLAHRAQLRTRMKLPSICSRIHNTKHGRERRRVRSPSAKHSRRRRQTGKTVAAECGNQQTHKKKRIHTHTSVAHIFLSQSNTLIASCAAHVKDNSK